MRCLILAAVLRLLAFAPTSLSAQAGADSTAGTLGRLVRELSPSDRVRIASAGERWAGRVGARWADSLAVTGEYGQRTVQLSTIDSLWVRRGSHTGLAAGAGFGTLMFGLLHLGNGGDPSTANKLGAIVFLSAAGAGLVIDALSGSWLRRYPE